jgi:DNA-binding LacI/PurR family transcriptional regulator
VPLVLVGGAAARVTAPSFSIDNQAIGRLATEHLLAGGSRRIAVITGPLDWWESQQRVDGWRRSMMAARMGSLDGLVVEGDWTAASGEEGLHRLLRESPGVDAVFASNDQMALGVLHAAHRLGLRVPEDLAVVGVDDIAEGSHYWPPLTTVHQPLRDAGVLAVEAVLCMIGASRHARTPEEPDPPSRVLQPTLIVRQSTRRVTGT